MTKIYRSTSDYERAEEITEWKWNWSVESVQEYRPQFKDRRVRIEGDVR